MVLVTFYGTVMKLARFERTTANSITSADNELAGERNGRIRGGHCFTVISDWE